MFEHIWDFPATDAKGEVVRLIEIRGYVGADGEGQLREGRTAIQTVDGVTLEHLGPGRYRDSRTGEEYTSDAPGAP